MASEMMFIRVLEHDTCDQIRIGRSFPIYEEQLEKAVENVKKDYNKEMAWCGGWTEENNNKYHQRIALVDAKTLQSVKEVWNKTTN